MLRRTHVRPGIVLSTAILLVPVFLLPLHAAVRQDGSLDAVLGELPPGFDETPGAPRRGALVLAVVTSGAGDRKGLREGDVIVEFENEAVTSAWKLAGRIRREGEGAVVSITVWRDGRRTWLGLVRLSAAAAPPASELDVAALRDEVAALRDEVAALREEVEALRDEAQGGG